MRETTPIDPSTPSPPAAARDLYPWLLQWVRGKVGDGPAYEITQEVFKIYTAKAQVEQILLPKPYLLKIARFRVYKHYEALRRTSEPFDSSVQSLVIDRPQPSPDTLLDRQDRHVRLRAALEALPADHLLAIEFRYIHELEMKDVAVALDVSLATAKRYVRAALDRLRDRLRAEDLGDDITRSIREACGGR
jgi:RNA polymerase sigma factor (sigma-70 family)